MKRINQLMLTLAVACPCWSCRRVLPPPGGGLGEVNITAAATP